MKRFLGYEKEPMRLFFSYDSGENRPFTLHDTEEEARDATKESFQCYQDEAYEGWSDDVTEVCWGEVRQAVVEISSCYVTKEDPRDWDEIVDYALKNIEDLGRQDDKS